MNRVLKSVLYGLLINAVFFGVFFGLRKKSIVVAHTTTAQPAAHIQDVAGKEALDRLHRQQDEFHNGQKLVNDRLKLSNAHLDSEIAELQGKAKKLGKIASAQAQVDADEAAGYSANWHGIVNLASKSSTYDGLTMLTLFLDCSAAIIDKHNAAFPKEPWAGVADLRDKIGGAPNKARQEIAAACAVDGNLAAAIRNRMQKEW